MIRRAIRLFSGSLIIVCTTTFATDLHETECAYVRIGSELCVDEHAYRATRMPRAKKALESLLNMPIADYEMPRIAVCSSGGGYRAMLSTLGLLQGMQTLPQQRSLISSLYETGTTLWQKMTRLAAYYVAYLLGGDDTYVPNLALPQDIHSNTLFDACTYCSCLSGSSWAVAGWLQSRKSIDEYLDYVSTHIQNNLFLNLDIDNALITLARKYEHDQHISLIDIYGILLAQTLLGNLGAQNPNNFRLGSDRDYATSGAIPLPIHTAIVGEESDDYEWVEFTPYEVGSAYTQSYVPAWAFGRKFENGVSQDFAPPQSLGLCMGLWGSAMCVNTKEFLELLQPHLERWEDTTNGAQAHALDMVHDGISMLLAAYGIKNRECTRNLLDRRLSPAKAFNWNYKLRSRPLARCKELTLVDAGIDFRIAMPPLLRPERNVNIIIILDNSDRALGTELRLLEAYAHKRGLALPPIDYSVVDQPCSVHKHPTDANVPVLIYLPLVKNDDYFNDWDPREAEFAQTYHFAYTQQQSALVAGLAKHTMIEYQPMILATIKEWILNRRAQSSV